MALLPDDLLCVIFQWTHAEAVANLLHRKNGGLDWQEARSLLSLLRSLCRVCRRWRRLALSISSLWSCLPMEEKLLWMQDGPLDTRLKTKRQRDFTLKDFVRRSGAQPLTLIVDYRFAKKPSPYMTLSYMHIYQRIRTLDITVHRPASLDSLVQRDLPELQHLRLRAAHLTGSNHWDWLCLHALRLLSLKMDDCRIAFGVPVTPLSAPRLEHLRVDVSGRSNVQLLLDSDMPCLQKLHIISRHFPSFSQLLPGDWPLLRHLTLEGTMYEGRGGGFLQACSTIDRLTRCGNPDLPHYETLDWYIEALTDFDGGLLPNLHHLELQSGVVSLEAWQKLVDFKERGPHLQLETIALDSIMLRIGEGEEDIPMAACTFSFNSPNDGGPVSL